MDTWKPFKPTILVLLWLAMHQVGCLMAQPASAPNLAPAVGIRTLEAPGIHNLFALGTNLFSGSSPEGPEAFAALARLGVKTIISVDGSKPDLENAHKHGIRYVHLPHGYDGIGIETQLKLIRASRTQPGPVYIHCHHGKHRGPTAAAVICMANGVLNQPQAEAWMKTAGTAANYAGLYETVRRFKVPSRSQVDAINPVFPELAKVSGLVDAMVEIDNRWENLKAIRSAGYAVPTSHPDLKPTHELVLFKEHFRESQRLEESRRKGTDFIRKLEMAERVAEETELQMRGWEAEHLPETRVLLDKAFDALGRSCTSCHKQFRDTTTPARRP